MARHRLFFSVCAIFWLASCGSQSLTPRSDQSPALASASERLAAWELHASGFSEYRITDDEARSGSASENVAIWAAKAAGGRELKATRFMGAASALDSIYAEKLFKLRSIYEEHRDAYFAVVTKRTSCPEKFRIREAPSAQGIFLSLYANERGTPGACDEKSARQKLQIAFLRCGSTLVQIESLVPLAGLAPQDETGFRSIECLR